MNDIAPWISGTLLALLALFGLFVASRAADGPFHLFGLVLSLFGVLAVFGLIARATRTPRSAHGGGGVRIDGEVVESPSGPAPAQAVPRETGRGRTRRAIATSAERQGEVR
jgi:hypothetical protein